MLQLEPKRRKIDVSLSKGSKQLSELNRYCSAVPVKTPSPQLRPLEVGTDSFHLATQMTKRIVEVFELFKDNVECNLKFTASGLDVLALYYDKTVYVSIHFGKSAFSEVRCPSQVLACFNLSVLSKKLSTLNKFKPRKLQFENTGTDLSITGFPEATAPGTVVIHSLASVIDELDTGSFKYELLIRVASDELAKTLEAMPPIFTISMDHNLSALSFFGEDDLSSIRLSLQLSAPVVQKVAQCTSMSSYKACFLKSNIIPVIRSSKLAAFVSLGLSDGCPLFVCYNITDSCDLNPQSDSKVCLYFAPKSEESHFSN